MSNTIGVDVSSLQQLKGVKMLWHNKYWDGPLDGICEYKGKLHYFSMLDEATERRRFVVYKLTEAEIAEQVKWHDLFIKFVGTHCDYRKLRKSHDADSSGMRPEKFHKSFYEPFQAEHKDPQLEPEKIVGWFWE